MLFVTGSFSFESLKRIEAMQLHRLIAYIRGMKEKDLEVHVEWKWEFMCRFSKIFLNLKISRIFSIEN